MGIWECGSAGRWSLVMSGSSQRRARLEGSGGGLRVPSPCPWALFGLSGQGEMMLQLSQLQWARKRCFPSAFPNHHRSWEASKATPLGDTSLAFLGFLVFFI